jgi:hypothetical protein
MLYTATLRPSPTSDRKAFVHFRSTLKTTAALTKQARLRATETGHGDFLVTEVEPAWCTQDMGLMTDCGDDAEVLRDGFPLCARHARAHDALVKAEKEI